MGRANIRNEQGRMAAGTWVLLIIVAGVVYVATKVGPPWIDYFMLNDKAGNLTKMTNPPAEDEIRSELERIVNDRNIPLDMNKNLKIVRKERSVSIRADWTVTIEFPGGKTWDLPFTIEAQR